MIANPFLDISLVQCYLYWEDKKKNFNHIEKLLFDINNLGDIIILPEMFNTGFTMNISLAEDMSGETIAWMKNLCNKTKKAICGSIIIKENDKIYNRFLFVTPVGELFHYDKKHLFRIAEENNLFTPGEDKLIINYKGWKILPQICYDLRFPVFSRNIINSASEYDLAIYVANWPERRKNAWNALLPARAVENTAYVAAVNRIGIDGNSVNFSGNSGVFGVLGDNLLPFKENEEEVKHFSLDYNWLQEFRKSFPVWKDADVFKII